MIVEDKNFRGHTAMLSANIIFGLNMAVSKMALSSGFVTAYALTLYRMIGAAILFWIISIFTKQEKVSRRDIALLFFASLFGIQLNQVFFISGLSLTSPINASIIATMVPLITMVIAALYLKEPITWKKAIGVLMGATGAIVLIVSSNTGNQDSNILGDILCMCSALAFATYLTVFRDVIRRYSSVTLMKWMFLFAAICCLPLGYRDVAATDWAMFSNVLFMEVGYVVIFATFVAYLLIPVGQKSLRPTIVSMYNYIQPLVASLVAVTIGLDTFGWHKTLAAVLVFMGVYVATKSKSRAQTETFKE